MKKLDLALQEWDDTEQERNAIRLAKQAEAEEDHRLSIIKANEATARRQARQDLSEIASYFLNPDQPVFLKGPIECKKPFEIIIHNPLKLIWFNDRMRYKFLIEEVKKLYDCKE